MSEHLRREIEALKKMILTLAAVVSESVSRAVSAVERRDPALARKVIADDAEIDHREIEVEESVLKILALHQPVATDLRFLVAILKMNNDLERIGDLAVNIAERAIFLDRISGMDIPMEFVDMARKAQAMLRKSIDSLVELDPRLAREVCVSDDEVDAMNRETYTAVREGIRSNPESLDANIHRLSISHHLERIADHATNIAEDVVYLVEGRIVRHGAGSDDGIGDPNRATIVRGEDYPSRD
ncbi:MAG: phosphate signaling complex protein PhoU [Planctomycetota bacterium]